MQNAIRETEFKSLKFKQRGKVRDIYDLGDALLMVTSDRISAFDVILPNPMPGKGKVLTQISLFWFDIMETLVPNHIISSNVDEYPEECRRSHGGANGVDRAAPTHVAHSARKRLGTGRD